MNRKKNILMISTFAKATVIMLLLGLFAPTFAYAETHQEQYQNVNEQYQISQDRINGAHQSYQDSREKFIDARARYENARTNETILDLKNATRNYLFNAIDYIDTRLELMEENAIRAEDGDFAPFIFSDNIEGYRNQINDLENDVEAAETREEFQAVISEAKDTWLNVKFESRYFITGVANNRVDSFLARGESISDRIDTEIGMLADADKDTDKLKQLQDEYNKALEKAKDSHEKVNGLFSTHNGFDNEGVLEDADDASKFLDEASSLMKETNQQLKDAYTGISEIFTELKQHRLGSVNLDGTGKLTASGSGEATMSGNMKASEISAKGGILTITDYDGNAKVDVTGNGTKDDMGNGVVKYSGFNGTASISGSSVTVVILGDDIDLTVEGIGSVMLIGDGTYDVKKDDQLITSNSWTPPQADDMNQNQSENSTVNTGGS